MRDTSGIIAFSALLTSLSNKKPRNVQHRSIIPRNHANHITAVQAKRERKLARNRRVNPSEE